MLRADRPAAGGASMIRHGRRLDRSARSKWLPPQGVRDWDGVPAASPGGVRDAHSPVWQADRVSREGFDRSPGWPRPRWVHSGVTRTKASLACHGTTVMGCHFPHADSTTPPFRILPLRRRKRHALVAKTSRSPGAARLTATARLLPDGALSRG